MSDCGLVTIFEYRARVELKKKYFSKENSIPLPMETSLQKLSNGDLMGVFIVGSAFLALTIIFFLSEIVKIKPRERRFLKLDLKRQIALKF